MRYSLLAVAATCAAFLGAGNTRADAQQVPKIKFEKFTLPNGLEVIVHEDHSTPIVAVDTWYHVGSGHEKPGRTGFAHLFEHVMFMGSKNVQPGVFDKLLESSGADNNGSTTADRTNYYETGPSNMLPLALWLDADRMGWLLPTMDQSKLDAQRGVVKEERNQRVDNVPYGRANETIAAALYPASHPYSWPVIGSMTDLSAASLDDVHGFFKLYYAPNNATIVIAGDVRTDSVRALVTKYFGDIPRNPNVPPKPAVQLVTRAKDTVLVLEDRVQLPRMYYVWPTVQQFHADEAALDHFAAILGGGRTSRLYRRLVYDMQIATDVTVGHPTGKLAGTFTIVATAAPGHTPAELAKVIDDELARVIADGVTDAELERARNSRRASFLNSLTSILGKAEQLNFYNDAAGTPDYVQEDAVRYERVTRADIQRVAAKFLAKGRVILTVVPQGKRDLALTTGAR